LAASHASTQFTIADAEATLDSACSYANLASAGAHLIRLGENALFRLADDLVVVRIARSAAVLRDAEKEVAVASWLRDSGLPVAEPLDLAQPILALGRPVTFWKLIDDSGAKATLADLAAILRSLHALPVPDSLHLPAFEIFDRVANRIARTDHLADQNRDFLATRLDHLREAYTDLDFALPAGAIHGDAHQANLIRKPDGTIILIDFERFAFGPPESDLAMTATEHLIGWHTDTDYRAFCDTYGFDVMQWSGFPVIRAINELKMTTWLMQNVGESDAIADEFRTRLASLHDDDAPRNWRPF
jgi:Ser/Thr protein kinase RdoA (MazF antagonist)